MIGRACALFLLAAMTLAAAAGPASAQSERDSVTVEGRVLNGSTGLDVGPGLDVFLVSSVGPEYEVGTATDEEGRFRFDAAAPREGERLGISVRYQRATYGVIVQIAEGRADPVMVTVYEASEDEGLLAASSASLLFARADKASQTLWALEIVRLVNSSDRTYIPGSGPMQLLRFGLPPGAQGLTVDTALIGADVLQVDRGFALTSPVPPGEHEVMYGYYFPYDGGELELTKTLRYGADKLRILVPEEVAALSGEAGEVERVTIGNTPYQLVESADIGRGARVDIRLEALPQASGMDRARQAIGALPLEYAAVVGLGLVMAALLGFALLSRKAARAESSAGRVGLIRELARLDAKFEAGGMDKGEYDRARRSLTTRITSLGPRPSEGAETQ